MIRRISADETVEVRWPILRAGMPRAAAIFPEDDLPDAVHLGAIEEERLVGVVTIFPMPFPLQPETSGSWQLRGMATVPEVQGNGHGRALLAACMEELRTRRASLVWCNARVPASEFYRKHGWAPQGEIFEIPTAGPHVRMVRRV